MKAKTFAQAVLMAVFAIAAHANDSDRQKTPDIFALPLFAKAEGDIHFGYGTKAEDGTFTPAHPTKKRFSHNGKDYLVAIDNGYGFAGSEPYPRAWFYIFDKANEAWICFQETRFRNVSRLGAELDRAKGEIVIRATGKDRHKGKILTAFNLLATSDNSSFVRPQK